MKKIDLFEFLAEFPYWKYFKQQFYYIVNPVAHLKELVRVYRQGFGLDKEERMFFALFGKPVEHSKSPLMYNLAFKGLEFDGCYTRLLLEDGDKIRETFFALGLKGCNIASPYKEKAYHACDIVDETAKKTGVVNTIVNRGGKLYGYNTDAEGFLKSIKALNTGKKVLLLGTGSTARSTALALKDNGYEVTVLGRDKQKLNFFNKQKIPACTATDFKNEGYNLVVNMTSAGLEDDNLPAPLELLKEVIPKAEACVDAIYNKETPFLKLAKSHGIPTKDGSDMLLYQGVLSLIHFTESEYGHYPFEEVRKHMEKGLAFN